MDFINVEPCDLIQIISKIKINVVYLELNQKCTIQTSCYDENGRILTTYMCEIVQPEYDNWQQDEWLENYILEKYGFVRKNIELI